MLTLLLLILVRVFSRRDIIGAMILIPGRTMQNEKGQIKSKA